MTTAEDVQDVIVMSGTCVLGAWVSDFIRQAYSLSERHAEIHSGDGDGDLAVADIGRTQGVPRVMMVAAPGRAILAALAGRLVPVVAVLDDPLDSVRYAMMTRSWPFLDALRRQIGSTAGHHLLRDNPAVLLVERGMPKPARAMLAGVMAHLGLRVRAAAEAGLLDLFAGPEAQLLSVEEALASRVAHYERLEQTADVLTGDEATIIAQLLAPMVRGAWEADIGPVIWPAVTLRAVETADAAGGGAVALAGPGFHLPPGAWSVRVVVALSPAVRGVPVQLVFEGDGEPIARAMIKANDGGLFAGTFAANHRHPEHPIAIHVTADTPIAEGDVALGQVTFVRTGPASPMDQSDE